MIILTFNRAIVEVFPKALAETVKTPISGSTETLPAPTIERILLFQQPFCAKAMAIRATKRRAFINISIK
jgi:hypothetical protein